MTFDVIIADDHPIFRQALVSIIRGIKEVNKIFEANNGQETINLLEQNKCLIVFLDLDMPVMNGEECIKIINSKFPSAKVIVMSMFDNKDIIKKMYSLGCIGFLSKSEGREEILKAVDDVAQGKKFYSTKTSKILMGE